METGAVVAVTTQPADRGDTQSIHVTTQEALDTLADVLEDPEAAEQVSDELLAEIVSDKGYHSNAVLTEYQKLGIRTYISEPKRGRRNWRKSSAAKAATYGNRRRIQGERGKALLRKRGERVERSFAHCYETGRLRRTHLRGHQNIHKRQLVHVAASNLGLVMRRRFGLGTPRGLQGRLSAALASLRTLISRLRGCFRALHAFSDGQLRRSTAVRFARCAYLAA
jgi:transposase